MLWTPLLSVRSHLIVIAGSLGNTEITAGKIQEYRVHRHQEATANCGKPAGHSTLHQEMVTLRQTLKTALRHGWLDRLPDFSKPYRSSPKISPWAWFSAEEYKKLYEATRKRAQEPKRKGFNWEAEQLHNFVHSSICPPRTVARQRAKASKTWQHPTS